MQSMKKVQQGFTLIELMIVVAIIGILAAIALPAYQDYTARAQASEALTSTAGVRADIALYLSENGDLVGVTGDAAIADAVANLTGRYFAGIEVEDETGMITVTFDDGVHTDLEMTITPTVNETTAQVEGWLCDGSVQQRHMPSACRQP
jgi:type IV pilus assembly protein PilA